MVFLAFLPSQILTDLDFALSFFPCLSWERVNGEQMSSVWTKKENFR